MRVLALLLLTVVTAVSTAVIDGYRDYVKQCHWEQYVREGNLPKVRALLSEQQPELGLKW